MIITPAFFVGTVAAVGVLHTLVPDHWMPIAILARRERWSAGRAVRTAAIAGFGHTASTLVIALIFWLGGRLLAESAGRLAGVASSLGLIAIGAWVTLGAVHELRGHGHARGHGNSHDAGHDHDHHEKRSLRTALLLVLGSSPMVEGIPVFFAAWKYGLGTMLWMAAAFALSTIATYVIVVAGALAGLERIRLGSFERYGEVLSGALIVCLGVASLVLPY